MKLIFAVINNDDSHEVSTELTKNGFSATKLASTGGFLMSGNSTFLICTDEQRVDEVIDIIRNCSRRRKQFVPTTPSAAAGGGYCFLPCGGIRRRRHCARNGHRALREALI